jgi:hypothetical protein
MRHGEHLEKPLHSRLEAWDVEQLIKQGPPLMTLFNNCVTENEASAASAVADHAHLAFRIVNKDVSTAARQLSEDVMSPEHRRLETSVGRSMRGCTLLHCAIQVSCMQ